MAINLNEFSMSEMIAHMNDSFLRQSFAQAGLSCTWRTMQQYDFIPAYNVRINATTRKQHCGFHIMQQLQKIRKRNSSYIKITAQSVSLKVVLKTICIKKLIGLYT